MISRINILYIFAFLQAFSVTHKIMAQEVDPYDIINKVKAVTDQIKDYTADVEIEVDVDFINIPVKHASIYFKAPDKVKFKSDDFFMIPKRAINNSFRKLLNSEYSAIYTGNEIIDKKDYTIVKIIPLEKKSDIILATLWIDTVNYTISRIESNTRNDGTYNIDFVYNDPRIPLPSIMQISFEIGKMRIPLKFIGKSSGVDMEELKTEGKQKGSVYLRFSNYEVNSFLNDSIFIEDDNDLE